MKCFVLNGWAASHDAWKLCTFPRERVFSYVEQLDGQHRRALENVDGAVLAGWSMGASMALSLAADNPGKIKGLVLVAATARMMEDRPSGWKGMSPRRLDALRRGLELTRGEGFFGPPAGKPNPYMMDTPENLSRGLAYLLETDLRERLAAASTALGGAQVRIFQSARDGIVRAENVAFLESVFPQAKTEIIEGAEHALPIMIPERIDEAVFDIMAGK